MTTAQTTENNTPDLDWGMGDQNTTPAAEAGAAAEANAAIAAAASAPAPGADETTGAAGAETTGADASGAETTGAAGAETTGAETTGAQTTGTETTGSDEEGGDVSGKLAALNAERAAALKKIEDKFAKREFDLRRKSQSMSERKGVAFDAMEGMRQRVRDQIEQPYMDDAAVDVLIEKAFAAGVGSLSAE